LYALLGQEVDLEMWRKEYTLMYENWLENDDLGICDLQSPTIQAMLKALKNVNQILPKKLHLCFWYDIDRTENEDFK